MSGDATSKAWRVGEQPNGAPLLAAYDPDQKLGCGEKIRDLPRASREFYLRQAERGARYTAEEDVIHGSRHERIAEHRGNGA